LNAPPQIRNAESADAPAIARLVNTAFRAERFFADADRTDPDKVIALLQRGKFLMLFEDEKLAGCCSGIGCCFAGQKKGAPKRAEASRRKQNFKNNNCSAGQTQSLFSSQLQTTRSASETGCLHRLPRDVRGRGDALHAQFELIGIRGALESGFVIHQPRLE
jgi:hypothetical protein